MNDALSQWSLAQLGMICGASLTVAAYLCRLGALDVRVHKFPAALWHLALCWATLLSGFRAWSEQPTVQDVALVAIAAAWIVSSYREWSRGVPKNLWRGPPDPLAQAYDDLGHRLRKR